MRNGTQLSLFDSPSAPGAAEGDSCRAGGSLPLDVQRRIDREACHHPDLVCMVPSDDAKYRAVCTRCGEVLGEARGPVALVRFFEDLGEANLAAVVENELARSGLIKDGRGS